MRYKVSAPRDPSSDRFVLSKGHAAPALYAAWAEAGLFPVTDLEKLRKLGSDLEGHPTPRLNFIDVGTGSLGQGLAIAGGMAYVGKNYDKANYRCVCVCVNYRFHNFTQSINQSSTGRLMFQSLLPCR